MRKLTIGVAVNLKNYESLRVEVSDEVEGEEGAQELARFLDHTLALFGRENPETAELVGQYRRRVLGGLATASGQEHGVAAPAPRLAPTPPAADAPAPVRAAPGPTPATPPAPGAVSAAKAAAGPGGKTTPATATPGSKAPPTPEVRERLSFTPASRVIPPTTPAPEPPVTPPKKAASAGTPAPGAVSPAAPVTEPSIEAPKQTVPAATPAREAKPATTTAPRAGSAHPGTKPLPVTGEAPAPAATTPISEPPAGPTKTPPAETPVPKPAAKAPAPTPTGAVCEDCGVSVSAAEERASRLFASRTLCKRCLQKI